MVSQPKRAILEIAKKVNAEFVSHIPNCTKAELEYMQLYHRCDDWHDDERWAEFEQLTLTYSQLME